MTGKQPAALQQATDCVQYAPNSLGGVDAMPLSELKLQLFKLLS
jgi:hypothetical protein